MTQWEAELTELATRRGGALVGYAYSLCQDRAQAEDLVQDALVKVFSRLRRPTGTGGGKSVVHLDQPQHTNAEGYVRRAILTIYLDGYRRQKSWSGFKHLLADDERSPAADRVATARVDVGVALAQLSPRQREAVVLRFFEDLTVPQIAAALGTRPGTIKRYLSDATELLRASLAEIVAPELDSSLDERLDVMAGAVRRRRATKVGAVAGVSMALAVSLVWGAWAVKPWIRSEPLPADDKVEYTPGYVPTNWPDDAGVYCGMPVEELEALDEGTFEVEVTGDLAPRANGVSTTFWEVPVTVTGTVPDDLTDDERGYFITAPLIVWAHDGRVVDLGTGWRERDSDVSWALSEKGSWSGPATAGNATTCLEDTLVEGGVGDEYDNERPGASYELRVVMSDNNSASGRADGRSLLVSDPFTVDLESGVAPAPTFAAPSEQCSGAAYAGRGLRVQDLPERTEATAAELLAAVVTCDERKVAELGGALDVAPLSQPVSPTVNEVFVLPEADDQVPYATVARLLSETRPATDASGLTWTWPRVVRAIDDDAAWQEAIDAGAITEEQAAADRAKDIYTGWRLEIDDNGEPSPVTWRAFYEGADDWCDSPVAAAADPECS